MSGENNTLIHHLQAVHPSRDPSCSDLLTATTTTNRLNNYKNNARSIEDLKKRQNESNIEIRKQHKDLQLLKRRIFTIKEEYDLTEDVQLHDNDHSTLQSIRKTLSQEINHPIEYLIKENVVQHLIRHLENSDHPEIQFEAAWSLSNIVSGTSLHTRHVVELGAITPLVKLLSSPNSNVCEQALWALGNIAGDGSELRDLAISFGIIDPILALIRPETPNSLIRLIAWTLSNLCRHKSQAPSMNIIQQILPKLSSFLYINDKEILKETSWALSYITAGSTEEKNAVIETAIIPRLVELLELYAEDDISILRPVLRCVGNIVTGTEKQTQSIIDSNPLPLFKTLLKHSNIGVQKEAVWTLSNIIAGTQLQIQSVISSELVPLLVNLLAKGEFRVQKEVAFAITNFTSGGNTEQMQYLIDTCQAIKPMCDLLDTKEPNLIKVLLGGLRNILLVLEKGGQLKQSRLYFEEIGGLEKIENLQDHQNEDVYKIAYEMMEHFFSEDNDEEDFMSTETNNNQYKFIDSETTLTDKLFDDCNASKFTF